ncbi:IS1634 family transposase [Thorsellia kenyensis]|uniref:IS1634 family transposase n=1 Tax=Thorsellia kenyensis TaxID=1549888 RepID=A0ABV6CC71_9GAMM
MNLDLTRSHVDGTAYNNNTPDDRDKFIRIVQGYSRDHRPELNQAILTLITENQAEIPIDLEALSGNAEDKSTFHDIIKSQLDSLKAAENNQYLIADSALYTKATIQSLHEKNRYFITRVSSVSNDAKAVSNRPDLAAFMPICDGYEGYYTDSNYADVPQKWPVIHSQAVRERALKTFAMG